MNTNRWRSVAGVVAGFFWSGQIWKVEARFASSEEVPITRLLATAEAVAQRQPDSAEAHYILARIHYLAFSRDAFTIPAYSYLLEGNVAIPSAAHIHHDWQEAQWQHAQELARNELGVAETPDYKDERFWAAVRRHQTELRKANWRPPHLPIDARAAHAQLAFKEFRKALQLAPDKPLYLLGLASLTDEVFAWRKTEKPQNVPATLESPTEIEVRNGYWRAYELGFKEDRRLTVQPVSGPGSLVSWEAGENYRRLTEGESFAWESDVQQKRQAIDDSLKYLKQLRSGAITPIVLSLQPTQRLQSLLDLGANVAFDLRGYGPRERWPWLRPEAGLLVWDPNRTGRIRDASQLFGGYSFQIFRANGYEALAALDEDGDGMLRSDELRGIRVWFDHNGDGISAPEEVCDLSELGIVALATRATGHDDVHPTNSAGVVFAEATPYPHGTG